MWPVWFEWFGDISDISALVQLKLRARERRRIAIATLWLCGLSDPRVRLGALRVSCFWGTKLSGACIKHLAPPWRFRQIQITWRMLSGLAFLAIHVNRVW